MRPAVDSTGTAPDLRLQLRIMRALMSALVVVGVLLTTAYFAGFGDSTAADAAQPFAAADTSAAPTTTLAAGATSSSVAADTTTSTSSTTTTTLPGTPVHGPRYVVAANEAEPEAKQLAADIAYALTTYEQSADPTVRFSTIAGSAGIDDLAAASAPLTYQGQWSRGEIIYPQLGGLENGRTSVMVITRQTIGAGALAQFSVVRTIDVRLIENGDGWVFDELASAGGTFDTLEGLQLAHAVADDPRIEMPDSARLDIRDGEVSPLLLQLMLDLADVTPYGVTVMATGHPYHVFETDRVSHHTLGRAIDIYRVGPDLVVDDRDPDSTTRSIALWLFEHPSVIQVGSPWDFDGDEERGSFVDDVHQDHIHVAVVEETDGT